MPRRQRERRRDELISLQQRIGEEWAEGLVGREVDVLVEGYNDDGWLIGRTQVRSGRGGGSDSCRSKSCAHLHSTRTHTRTCCCCMLTLHCKLDMNLAAHTHTDTDTRHAPRTVWAPVYPHAH